MILKPRMNQLVWMPSVSIVIMTASQADAADTHWAKPMSGDWEIASNWADEFVPGRFDRAELGLFGKYMVEFKFDRIVGSISITNPDASLALLHNTEIELIQSLENNGTILIDPYQGKAQAQLFFSSSQTISGIGKLTLGSPDALLRFENNRVVTQESLHEINGLGRIHGDMLNRGVLHANAGGILEFYQSELNQDATGIARASGKDSVFQLNQSSLVGGTVETSNGGRFKIENSGSISGVVIENEFVIDVNGPNQIENSHLLNANVTLLSEFGSSLFFKTDNELLGTGSFFLDPSHPNGGLQLQQDFILPESYIIRGQGRINGVGITNHSHILADQPGKVLQILSQIQNQGLMGVENGAILELKSSIQNKNGKIYASGEGSKVLFQNSSVFIENGTIQTFDGATIENRTSLYLNNTLLLCEILSKPDSFLSLTGLIYHDQPIVIDNATLKLESHGIIYGPGVIRMQGDLALLTGSEYSFTDFTNGAGHRIEGSGSIGTLTNFINGGIVSANRTGETLRINRRAAKNYGQFEAVNGGVLIIYSSVFQSAGAMILASGSGSRVDLSGTGDTSRPYTIQGGEIRSEQGGYFELKSNSRITDVIVNTDIQFPNYAILGVDGTCELNGVIDLVPSAESGGIVQVFEPYALRGTGTIRLGTPDDSARVMGGLSNDPLVIGTDFRIEGEGYLWGYFICDGTLAPGLDLGVLFCSQDIVLTNLSTLEIEVSPTSSDVLHCESTTTLNGTINIEFVEDFSPMEPWSREIIRSEELYIDSITLNMPEPSTGLVSRYSFSETTLRVGQSFLADMNLDGMLDFLDIEAFLASYMAGDLQADLNFDMKLDFIDIAAFIQSYKNTH